MNNQTTKMFIILLIIKSNLLVLQSCCLQIINRLIKIFYLLITHMEAHNDLSQSPKTQTKLQQLTDCQEEINKSKTVFTTEGLPFIIGKKIEGLVKALNQPVIDTQIIKKYLEAGIPDEAAIIRQFSWKIILSYLPQDKSKWQSTIQNQNKVYQGLVKMFLPQQKFVQYPIILKKGHPRFEELENDYLLWEQIQKDTSRTHAEFSFFATPSTEIMLPYLTNARRQKFRLINGEDEQEYKAFIANKQLQKKTYRYDYMTRILYIYSKLNPKIQYVQGMNEILAPIFYLVNVTKPANAIEEASCFFMFNNAICDIIELHIKDFDKSRNGIYGKLNQINQMLMVIEPNIWRRMDQLKIDPFFYCFRWITLLYAQDFALFDTLRIWESIFSSQNKMQYVKYLAIGIIISCKQVINENDFTAVLEHLQNIKENINVNEVIRITNQLIQEFNGSDFIALSEKEKLAIEKQKQKENQKRQKEKEKQEKNKLKEEQKNRKKEQKQREKEEKQREKEQRQREKQERSKESNQKQKTVEKKEQQKGETSSEKQQKPKKTKKSSKKVKEKSQTKSQIEPQKQQTSTVQTTPVEQKPLQTKSQTVSKKINGIFKKFGNMMDKFLN